MKRDIIGDIFLGGVLLSLLFLFSFPVYFSYAGIDRTPDERLLHYGLDPDDHLGLLEKESMGDRWCCGIWDPGFRSQVVSADGG